MEKRDTTIDILRGFAVLVMIPGNMAASILAQPYPLWWDVYRVFGSFVPALFILLAGMMVVLTTEKKGYTLKHFLMRGAGLMISAALVLDLLIWHMYPFLNIEVLYLIGLSLPLAYLFQKLSAPLRWILTCSIFLATPFLQNLLGYASTVTEVLLREQFSISFLDILHHWLIDGWFPIFPWLGFAFLGVNMGIARWREKQVFSKKHVYLAGVLMAIGSALWFFVPGPLYIRSGYSELIYPVTVGYILTNIGMILAYFIFVDKTSKKFFYNPLRVFGESALLMYVLHFAFIEYILNIFWGNEDSHTFLFVNAVFLPFMIWLAYIVRHYKERSPRASLFRKVVGL